MRELMHEKPMSSISVSDITERATINRATFYAHFQTKEELMQNILETELQQALHKQFCPGVAFTQENVIALAETVYHFLEHMHGNCPKSASDKESIISATLQKEIFEMLSFWVKEEWPISEFRGHSSESVATVFSWTIFGGAYQWMQSTPKPDARQHATHLVSLVFRGI
jgi:AcrR family transcriptional regulator